MTQCGYAAQALEQGALDVRLADVKKIQKKLARMGAYLPNAEK